MVKFMLNYLIGFCEKSHVQYTYMRTFDSLIFSLIRIFLLHLSKLSPGYSSGFFFLKIILNCFSATLGKALTLQKVKPQQNWSSFFICCLTRLENLWKIITVWVCSYPCPNAQPLWWQGGSWKAFSYRWWQHLLIKSQPVRLLYTWMEYLPAACKT